MKQSQYSFLLDKNAIGNLIACYIKEPSLIEDFPLNNEDVVLNQLVNLIKGVKFLRTNCEKIVLEELYTLMFKMHPGDAFVEKQMKTWLDFCYASSDVKNAEYYFSVIKKYSLMRDLHNGGFRTESLIDFTAFDLDGKLDKQKEEFNKMTTEDILAFFRDKYSILDDKYSDMVKKTNINASFGLRELKERMKLAPEIGLGFQGDIYTTVARGARLTKYYIRSASSGVGKTRTMMGDAVNIGIPYKYDWNYSKWIYTGQAQPCAFFTTELDFEEIQTMLIACVSGVNEDNIINGEYDSEFQEKIVDEAIDIIEKYSRIIIEYMPDPSASLLKSKIKSLVDKFGIKYIWYDYIHTTPSLLAEFRDLRIREDVALMMLSAMLKQTATDLNVHISTATQLNAEGNSTEAGFKGVNSIRGAKSIVDKCDMASIMSLITPEDLAMVAPIIKYLKLDIEPNVIIDVFKARRSKYKNIRIFSYIDLGTCRQTDLFATDMYGNPINMEILRIMMNEEGSVEKIHRNINISHIQKTNTTSTNVVMGFDIGERK